MTDAYKLNPYATVAELKGGFLLGANARLQLTFPKQQRPLVELLVSGRPLTRQQLKRFVSDSRIEEMLQKHILLSDGIPSVAGRYSRQSGFFSLISDDFESYQSCLERAHILLLGAGAIGSHMLWHLAAMGVKKITVVDFDVVEDTNLNRQLLYSMEDIGLSKVEVLCQKIAKFNPEVEVIPINQRICGPSDVEKLMIGKTLIVKAIDTPEESTEWVNQVCVKHGLPFITGGFLGDVGVVGPIYLPGKSVCFDCCHPGGEVKRIAGAGPTFAPLTGIVSSLMAMCVFRIIVGATGTIVDKLFTYNVFSDTWETVPLAPARACKVCGRQPEPSPQPARKGVSALWYYRAAIFLLMMLVGVGRIVTHDQYIGMVLLSVLFLSMPVLDLLCGKKPEETRREIFVISCIYILGALLIVGLQGGLPTGDAPQHWGFDAAFDLLGQFSLKIMEAAIGITCLFSLLVTFMHVLKSATGERERWMS
jgi:molybdopterin/thiamine biosynthesis adenylyltransferase